MREAPDPFMAAWAIAVDGEPMDADCSVVAIDVWTGVDTLPRCSLVIAAGAADGAVPIATFEALSLGRTLAISAGRGAESLLFSGLVERHRLEIRDDGAQLIVEARDKTAAMTLRRKTGVHGGAVTDGEAIETLIGAAGLTARVSATGAAGTPIVQLDSTDWELLLSLARRNAMVAVVLAGEVTVAAPDPGQAPALSLRYGRDILDFSAVVDDMPQAAAVADRLEPAFPRVRGQVRFPGSTSARPGCVVALEGLGAGFDGNAYVLAVHHRLADGAWIATAEIGRPSQILPADGNAGASAAAAATMPSAVHLQTAIVRSMAADPHGAARILVDLPRLDADSGGLWARLASFHASDRAGALFCPEIGDEVVIAFIDADPSAPVILGSLYGETRSPPVSPDISNWHKALATRSGLRIDFDDEQRAVAVSTPCGQSVRLDDTAQSIVISDSHGNKINMARDGITVDSAKALTLKAASDVAITAGGTLSLRGIGGVALAGRTIDAKADVSFAAHAPGEARLTADLQVSIEGGMVKIN